MASVENVELKFKDSSAVINTFGATVTSWKVGECEKLFVSKQAVFNNKKAIRGGIPLVFPNFGPWDLGPQHGFSRISSWTVKEPATQGPEGCRAVLTLTDSDATRQMWNYKFCLEYSVTLSESSLETNLTVHNTDEKPFDFTCLLHTYFRVADIAAVEVVGLKGSSYVDKVLGGTAVEDREAITIAANVDRVYSATRDVLEVREGGQTKVVVTKTGLPDTVVWNPWAEKAAGMSDFGDAEWRVMVCVEGGVVATPVVLAAGRSYCAGHLLSHKL